MRAIRADQVHALRAHLAGILAGEGDALVVRVHDGIVHVTARTGDHHLRVESDLQEPDAELRLAAKLVCFVERARNSSTVAD